MDVTASSQNVQVNYRSDIIDGLEIAYCEAGDPSRPTVLLLHGFPTSSHMFRNLIPTLAERYHVLAPDYPGFGASSMRAAEGFEYSFANIARIMTTLLDRNALIDMRFTSWITARPLATECLLPIPSAFPPSSSRTATPITRDCASSGIRSSPIGPIRLP